MHTKKKGFARRKQQYFCKSCGVQFSHKGSLQRIGFALWKRFALEYNTVTALARRYQKSEKWVRMQLDHYVNPPHTPTPRTTVVVADATFSGRQFGVLVFRDPHQKENLHWREIMTESVSAYQLGIAHLQQRGFTIAALVIDGKRGVKEAFPGIPVQLCQFHQVKTALRYLTRNPKLPASVALKEVVLMLKYSTKSEFTTLLDMWYDTWSTVLKEKTATLEDGTSPYTHRRLRSAYFSLRRNMSHLFIFEEYPELNIPKTTNGLEGVFSHVKIAIRIHRGLTQTRRKKLIGFLLRFL